MSMTAEESADYLFELVCTESGWLTPASCREWADRAAEIQPDIGTFIRELLDAGSDEGRNYVLYQLESACSTATIAPHETHPDTSQQKYSYPPYLNKIVVAGWTIGNMHHDSPGLETIGGIQWRVMAMRENLTTPNGDSYRDITDHRFSRGVAVLCMIEPMVLLSTPEQRDVARRFADFAGTHHDSQEIIDLVNSRGSYDVELISGIISEARSLAPAISNGVL